MSRELQEQVLPKVITKVIPELWPCILEFLINFFDYRDVVLFQAAISQSEPDRLCHALKLTLSPGFPDYLRLDTFLKICAKHSWQQGKWQQGKWLLTHSPNFLTLEQVSCVFRDACSKGNLDLAKWLWCRYSVAGPFFKAIYDACTNGHEPTVRWLTTEVERTTTVILQDLILRSTCESGHLHICRYLLGELQWLKGNPHYILDCQAMIRISCFHGHLQLAQWLQEFSRVKIERDNTLIEHVVSKGRLEMVQWLASHLDLRPIRQTLIHRAGTSGNLSLVQWLIAHYPVTFISGKVFTLLCYEGQGHIVKWLLEYLQISPRKDTPLLEGLFYCACIWNHLSLAQFIVSLLENKQSKKENKKERDKGKTSKRQKKKNRKGKVRDETLLYDDTTGKLRYDQEHEFTFRGACHLGSLETAQWMVGYFCLTRENTGHILDYCFRLAATAGHIELCKWLVEHFQMDVKALDWPHIINHLIKLESFPFFVRHFRIFHLHCVQNKAISLFLYMSKKGNLQIVQWLGTTFCCPLYIATAAFQSACEGGYLQLAQWLQSHYKVVPSHLGRLFQQVVSRDDLPMAHWLATCFQIDLGKYESDILEACHSLAARQNPVLRNWIIYHWNLDLEKNTDLGQVNVGQPFQITLAGNPTTGYSHRWYLPPEITLINQEYALLPEATGLGEGGTTIYTFLPLQTGSWYMFENYSRQWERDQPYHLNKYVVHVH